MGVAVFVSVDREFAGYDPSSVMGKALAAAIEQLDAASERLGVPSLSSFVSVDPASLDDFTSDEPPLTPEEAREQIAALRKSGGTDPELLDDLQALADLTANADPDATPPPEQWFDPKAAMPTVRALLDWLQQHPAAKLRAKPFTRDDVIADLRSVEDVLRDSARAGVRFHLAYDV